MVIALLFLFFNSLNWLTNHGQETKVPALTGKKMKDAISLLEDEGFRIEIDSTYQAQKKPLEILFQEPEAGATVKIGRTIFLTVNKKSVPTTNMPNLVNLSFRNALLTMQSYRLQMGDTNYRPDVAAGAVLEQWYKGKKIPIGTAIPFGAKIDLVIGEGLSDMQDVPNLIGKTFYEAKTIIESLGLTSNIIWDGAITDSANAVVYMQTPEEYNELDFKNTILSGDMIDLRIMQSPSQEVLDKNRSGSHKLLGDDSTDVLVADSAKLPTRHNIPDSLKTKNKIPGMHIPQVNKQTPLNSTPRGADKSNKPKDSNVIGNPKSKSTTPVKVDTKIKKSDDNIKNEYE